MLKPAAVGQLLAVGRVLTFGLLHAKSRHVVSMCGFLFRLPRRLGRGGLLCGSLLWFGWCCAAQWLICLDFVLCAVLLACTDVNLGNQCTTNQLVAVFDGGQTDCTHHRAKLLEANLFSFRGLVADVQFAKQHAALMRGRDDV